MKTGKILTISTIILLIAILSVASFGGIYKIVGYKIKNIVPNYVFGKEFSDCRVVNLTADDSASSTKIYDQEGNEVVDKEEDIEYTEENGYTIVETKVNPQESLTKENYIESKKIISKRLNSLGVDQYTVKLDEETGNIDIELPENDDTDKIISEIIASGKFEVLDSENKEVLLDNSYIKSARPVYGQSDASTTAIYLQIILNKEGSQKLEEISKIYVETKNEVVDEENQEEDQEENQEKSEEETTQKKEITISFSGQDLLTTYFGEPITNGTLNIPIGEAKNNSDLQKYITSAKDMEILMNKGIMPIIYKQTDEVKNNSFNLFQNKIVVYSIVAIAFVAFMFLVIKLKLKGLLGVILEVGYISILLLALRYLKIKITATGITGIAVSIILNYIYIYISLKNIDLNFIKDTTAKYALKLIPFYIIAIVFTFISNANISSIGMTLVWGIILMYLYNLSITQIVSKTIKD